MSFEELVPTSLAPFGTGVPSRLAHDLGHGGATDVMDAEFLQFPKNAGIAPAVVLPRQLQDQLAYFFLRPRATWLALRSLHSCPGSAQRQHASGRMCGRKRLR